jgi:hypothetical protein
MVRYRIYPTLLQAFSQYQHGITNAKGQVLVGFDEIIDRINRVPAPTTQAQQRGIDFESALITGRGEEHFPAHIVEEMRTRLPKQFKTQFRVRAVVKDVELYGLVDVVGSDRAVDVKTTGRYQPGRFARSFQNLYLLGLKAWNIGQLDYLITDFEQVYVESYFADTYDFGPLLDELDAFVDFLETNRRLITDQKIFKNAPDGLQTSLF